MKLAQTFGLALSLLATIAGAQTTIHLEAQGAPTAIAGPYKLSLIIGGAEPFYAARQIKTHRFKHGMLRIRGAAANPPGDPANCNLSVRVWDQNGKTISGAKVGIAFQKMARHSKMLAVPVVEMQAAGEGSQSTHYGNNVPMSAGNYNIWVRVNGFLHEFSVHLSEEIQDKRN